MFNFLPKEIEDIIIKDKEEMEREEHKQNFKKSLDLINSQEYEITKNYDGTTRSDRKLNDRHGAFYYDTVIKKRDYGFRILGMKKTDSAIILRNVPCGPALVMKNHTLLDGLNKYGLKVYDCTERKIFDPILDNKILIENDYN